MTTPITIIKCGWIITQNDAREILKQGYIAFDNAEIIYVGNNVPAFDPDRETIKIDASDCVAIPGLINGHSHTGMTTLRGMADDMPLMQWLEEKVWPMEAQLSQEDVYWGAKLAIVEMIRSGTTCFNDMYWHNHKIAQACLETGIRATLSGALIESNDGNHLLEKATAFHNEWNDHSSGLLKTAFGPHAIYTCSQSFLEKIAGEAKNLNAGINIHLSETEKEIHDCAEENQGMSPVDLLKKTGILERPVTAAHCIHLSDKDMEILFESKVVPVHNPSSNMKLAAGIMPATKMCKRGIEIALGTDSAVSNNNLSMLQEMRMASFLQKVSLGKADVLPAQTALDMATRNGASATGFIDKIGQLTPGYYADITLLNTQGAHTAPFTHPVSHIVYSMHPADVETVIIHGNIVLKNGSFIKIDENEIKAKAMEVARNIQI